MHFKFPLYSLLFLLFFTFFVVQSGFGAVKTWIGGTGTSLSWNLNGNWSPAGAPTTGDDIVFNTAGVITFITSPTGNRTFNSLTINAGVVNIGGTNRGFTLGGKSGADFVVASGASFNSNSINITLASNATATIAGTFTNVRTFNTNGTAVVATVTGTIVNLGVITNASASNLLFNSASIYQHSQNGGSIPTATWNTSSNCNITGIVSDVPGGLNQSFGNFTWNCAGQSSDISLGANLKTINGNFTVTLPSARQLILSGGTTTTLNVQGNFLLSAGTLNFNSGSNASTMNVAGNFTHTGGTITESGDGSGSVVFNGTAIQTYTSGGTVSNTINFTVNNLAYLQMGTGASPSTITGGGTFTLSAGATLGVTSPSGLTTSGTSGNIQSAGRTFTAGANYIFNGTSAQVTGSGFAANAPANVTISNAAGVSLSASRTISGNLLLTTGALLDLSANTLNRTTSGGTLSLNANSKLTLGGASNFPSNFGTIDLVNSSTVDYNVGDQLVSSQLYGNLTLSGGTKTLAAACTVNGNLSLTSSLLVLGASNLTLGATTSISGVFDANNMIVASGTGALRKFFTGAASFTFPIGDNVSVAEYSPFSLTINSATFSPGALVAVNVTDDKHPNISGTTNFISRFWTVTQTGLTNINAGINATFTANDIAGFDFSKVISSRFNSNNLEWTDHSAATATQLSATSISSFGDFTGRNNIPTIVTSLANLSGFNYTYGFGPSSIQLFDVSGSGLNTNIEVLPTDSFEISTLGGTSFVAMPLVRLNVLNREVLSTPVYVRLKAGLPAKSSIINSISCTSTNATSVNISCSGSVTGAPQIVLTPTSLTGFSYNLGATTSPSQPLLVTGSNLVSNITVTASTNYELATTASGTYASSLNLVQSGGNVNTTIYVRLKIGLQAVVYNETIQFTSTNAATVNLPCEGEVKRASLSVSKLALAGFIYKVGTGPSQIQSFTVSGSTLSDNVIVTPPTNFEISTDGVNFFSTARTIPQVSGAVTAVTVYVRLKSGYAIGVYGDQSITVAATGAISQTVKCSGQVSASVATISSVNTLNGFFYLFGKGPSVVQNFTVSGTSLLGPILIMAPSSFELSTNGTSFSSFLNIPNVGGFVNAATVYVRLKSALSVGTYNAESIVMTSPGAADVNIVANGKVLTTPTIVAGPAGLDSICPNTSVSLTSTGTNITNQTWSGPNGFSSTAANVSLGVVTAANNGNYIVTGNVLSGVNLLTNGNFELGNTGDLGFGTSYIHQRVAPAAKGNYWVCFNPQDVYGSFTNRGDHTTGSSYQMVVDGGTSNGMIVWSQTVSVVPNAEFQFKYWVQTVYNHANLASLQLFINNIPIGSATTAPAYAAGWQEFTYNANSGSSTSLQLTLINKSLQPDGNDFALDDLSLEQVLQVKDTVFLQVLPTLTPSVVVTASENPVYAGTLVTFTANVTNAGPSKSYQWQVGGVNVDGANGVTFDYAPTDGQVITCVVNSAYNCLTINPVSDSEIMEVRNRTNYWYGGVSEDWGTPANWTQGFVPLAGNDVVFATTDNYTSVAQRNLVLDIDRTIGNLINATTKSVIIPAGKSLIVNNNIVQTPLLTNLIQIKASTTLPNGTLVFNNTQSNLVKATVEMYSPASWDLTKPVNQKYNWQYFGIPVSSVGALPTFYGAYVRQRLEYKDKIENHWEQLTNESVLVPFKGYELCQKTANTLYTFTGDLINNDYNTGQLVKSEGVGALYPGQHLLANPYTCAINIKNLEFGADMEAIVYLYNTGTFTSWLEGSKSGFDTFSIPGHYNSVPKNQSGYADILGQIPSMSSFLVRILSGRSSSPQSYVAIDYSAVSSKNTDRQRSGAYTVSDEQTTTQLMVRGEYGADRMWLMSHNSYSNNYDNGYDGYKMLGTALNPQIFAIENGIKYQIDAIADLNNTSVSFQAGVDTDYTLTIVNNQATLQKYAKLFLHDLVTDKVVDVSKDTTHYSFSASTTADPIVRFKIITQQVEVGNVQNAACEVYSHDGKIRVQNFTENSGKVIVYDFSGKVIAMKTISGVENLSLTLPRKVVYIVKSVIGNKTDVTKLIVQ